MQSDAMFPPFRSNREFVRQQSMSGYEKHVEQAMGETLMLRDGRRSYRQRMLDRGVPIEYVSHCMGHDSVETTQKFYADYRDRMVLGKVGNILKNADNREIIGML